MRFVYEDRDDYGTLRATLTLEIPGEPPPGTIGEDDCRGLGDYLRDFLRGCGYAEATVNGLLGDADGVRRDKEARE